MPIDIKDPDLERIVSTSQELELLADGFGPEDDPAKDARAFGIATVAEGPMWWKEGGFLLFSHMTHDRRLKWAPGEGISIYHQGTNHTNGQTRDQQGRIIACESGARRVARLEHDGTATVVANRYRGTPINRPNDVAVKSDGSIYFTDPGAPNPDFDLDFAGVYRVSPDLGTINLLTWDFLAPNGLAFSPDERTLYIDDSRRGHVRAIGVQANGMLNMATDRVLCDTNGTGLPGVVDGIKVDMEGNLYVTGPGGVWIVTPAGKHLGTILTGSVQTTNCAWGGDDWKTLFITTQDSLFRIQTKIPGVPLPR